MKIKNKKETIPKKPKVPRKKSTRKTIEKIYNEGTMTSSAFFGMIRATLRNKSRWWKPILAVKNAAKIAYKGPNKRRKFSYICGECKNEFDSKQVNVHHKIPVGTLTCFEDLPLFTKNLFCEKQDLILLCSDCHDFVHNKKQLI
jgi:hypothetical protein